MVIIAEMEALGLSERFVFPGRRSDQPMSRSVMLNMLRTIDKSVAVRRISGRPSETGSPNKPTSRAKRPNWRSGTRSGIRPNAPTRAAT